MTMNQALILHYFTYHDKQFGLSRIMLVVNFENHGLFFLYSQIMRRFLSRIRHAKSLHHLVRVWHKIRDEQHFYGKMIQKYNIATALNSININKLRQIPEKNKCQVRVELTKRN